MMMIKPRVSIKQSGLYESNETKGSAQRRNNNQTNENETIETN